MPSFKPIIFLALVIGIALHNRMAAERSSYHGKLRSQNKFPKYIPLSKLDVELVMDRD